MKIFSELQNNVILICWGLWSKGWKTRIWWRDENGFFNERVSIPQLNKEYCDIRVRNDICIQWVHSIYWKDVKNGKPNNSDIVSNGLKWSFEECKVLFLWRTIGIGSFERKRIRSYALNWGYFSVWCDGNWRINGVIKCFNWIELFFVLFLFTGTKNMARLP